MSQWWQSLTLLQQIFACGAIPATLILILQMLLLIFGFFGDSDADVSHDSDGSHDIDGHDYDDGGDDVDVHDSGHGTVHDHGLRIFSLRAIVAFFAIAGWTGVVLGGEGGNMALAIAVAFAAGTAAMIGIAYFFKYAMRLQASGNIEEANAIGKTGTVYIRIPPNRTGTGKINLVVQDRFVEMDAVTDSDVLLTTGTEVICLSVAQQNVICVAPVVKNDIAAKARQKKVVGE